MIFQKSYFKIHHIYCNMMKCNKCKTERAPDDFFNEKKTNKLKTCISCREKVREWKRKNKERVSSYNKMYNDTKKNGTKVTIVLARKVGNKRWLKFRDQLHAANRLNLCPPNVNKVIKGSLKTTGGYEFKLGEKEYVKGDKTWEEIKEEEGITEKCKGQPSKHRVKHETIDGVVGKKCCHCKEWRPLNIYNNDKNHWDKLRNECKICLARYRKKNRKELTRKQLIYEKKRKKTDPNFKLACTLRSRIGSVLSKIKQGKYMHTMELVGCTIDELKQHLESQFDEGMTWENHGLWHIDHIIPCCSFDLTKKIDQQVCFNWSNLQPMWGEENLSKSGKYDQIDQNILHKKVTKRIIAKEIKRKIKIIH